MVCSVPIHNYIVQHHHGAVKGKEREKTQFQVDFDWRFWTPKKGFEAQGHERSMKSAPKFTVEQVAEALRESAGIRSAAARKLSCSVSTITNYVARHPELAGTEAEIVESNLDKAETQLLKAIASGNLAAIIFYLKCKGKGRGYVERTQVEGTGGGPVVVKPDLSSLTDDDLRKIREMIRGKDSN